MDCFSSNSIRFAIIGCGRIAQIYPEIFSDKIGGTVVAVCDKDIDKAKCLAEKFSTKVLAFGDFNEMLTTLYNQIDAVVILTEAGSHAKIACEVAKYKKHIIVEKPIALNLLDAEKIINACSDNNIQLFVVTQNRFNSAVLKAYDVFKDGKLGKLFLSTVRVRWCRDEVYYSHDSWRGSWDHDGGVIFNQAFHHIDLLNFFCGEYESISVASVKAIPYIEAADTVAVLVKYKSGCVGIIEATVAARPCDIEASLSLLGSCGTIEIGGLSVNQITKWYIDNNVDWNADMAKFNESPPNVYGFGYKRYIKDVINMIKLEKNSTQGIEAYNTLKMICSIREQL